MLHAYVTINMENMVIEKVQEQNLIKFGSGSIGGAKMCIYKTIIEYKKRCIYLWKSDDLLDYFVVNNGSILRFETQFDFESYIYRHQMNVLDEGTVIKILPRNDLLRLYRTDITSFCESLLNLWNLALDVKNSFSLERNLLDGHKKLYDKIFAGCNLETLASSQSKYTPVFSTLECRQIRAIINEAYRWFECKL